MQIRVFCRVKPHALPALTCGTDNVRAEVDGKEQSFGFDRVFPPAASQAEVFAEVSELVQSALDGYQVGCELSLRTGRVMQNTISKRRYSTIINADAVAFGKYT